MEKKIGDWVFDIEKRSSLAGHTEVVLRFGNFLISCSPFGVAFSGTFMVYGDQMKAYAELMGYAFTEHNKLKPKLTLSTTEH
jgi:hypothetical protein